MPKPPVVKQRPGPHVGFAAHSGSPGHHASQKLVREPPTLSFVKRRQVELASNFVIDGRGKAMWIGKRAGRQKGAAGRGSGGSRRGRVGDRRDSARHNSNTRSRDLAAKSEPVDTALAFAENAGGAADPMMRLKPRGGFSRPLQRRTHSVDVLS